MQTDSYIELRQALGIGMFPLYNGFKIWTIGQQNHLFRSTTKS